ncbi:Rho GTPase-activating protein 21, partial [Orchesella cincta]
GSSKPDKFTDSTEIIREGKVHFKIRIGENKRGTYNRSWRQGWAQARRSGYLYLSKERLQKEAVTGNEESVIISVSIRDGVFIEPAEDYTKRKNVLRIRTTFVPDDESNFPFVSTTEYYQNSVSVTSSSPQLTIEVLLQAEDPNDLILWLHCIQKQLENNNCNEETCSSSTQLNKGVAFGSEFYPKSKSFLTSLLPSPGTPPIQTSNSVDRTTNTTGVASSTSNSLNPNSVASMANTAASPKAKTWKGKVAKQWKKVHDIIDTTNTSTDNKSSPYASLPPAGATFGINLENCPPGEINPYVPRVIEYSIDLVEKKGIEMVGLYRIPGNNASVAILTDRLNRGEDPNPDKDSRWLDVHVVASLIKSFLRRLPDPLLTNDRYPAFIQAADENEETCLVKIKELIKGLPIHNYETLKAVVSHLKHVAEKGEMNRMDARNLAIVFGPTIVRTAGENFSSMVADMKNQCKIVEAFVLHVRTTHTKLSIFFRLCTVDFFYHSFLINNLVPQADKLFSETDDTIACPVVMRHPSRERKMCDETLSTSDTRKSVEVTKPLSPSSPVATIENELKVSLIKAAKRKVSAKENQPLFEHQQSLPADPKAELCKPVDEKGFIRSYAGLNEVTERRIRNFELETRAMLSRDDRSPNSSVFNIGAGSNKPVKAIDDIREQQLKLDDALRRAKDDLETEDIYDQIADNPSSIVHHRERGFGLCASSPGPFTLSNSSLSSSNSNSTAPSSLLTSSLPAWPTGNRNGPTPFRNSMPPQSLPPKPPTTASISSYPTSFDTVSPNAQVHSSMRRVNSFDRIQGSQSPCGVGNAATPNFNPMNISNKNSFRRSRRNDGTFAAGGGMITKQLGGSLDSLKDIVAETALMEDARLRTIRIGNDDDLSPRSSDGSDMVTTLTKTFDKKMEKLRNQFSETSLKTDPNDDISKEPTFPSESCPTAHNTDRTTSDGIPENKKLNYDIIQTSVPIQIDQIDIDQMNGSIHNNFIKKGRRRHSLIERRKTSFEGASKDFSAQSDGTRNNSASNTDSNSTPDSAIVKASKPKKLSKECRRRHSLSGATDILSLVFRGSEKLSVHRDSDAKKNKTLSSEALLTALKNASILESHV